MKKVIKPFFVFVIVAMMVACSKQEPAQAEAAVGKTVAAPGKKTPGMIIINDETEATTKAETKSETTAETKSETAAETKSATAEITSGSQVGLNSAWKYAEYSKINSGKATLYKPSSGGNGITVCVNAGHGTKGGTDVKTQCHPDGSAKVTGGTTGAGATTAIAVSGGMTFADGTPEYKVTLACAMKLKEKLLAKGYNVLMIRESDDVQLDNVARTVIANNMANCHIALHWDSTTGDKGAFYCSVPNNDSYRSMEPVASHWREHQTLGNSLIAGLKVANVKIWGGGWLDMDLTQTSYSTVPSVDIELGDAGSDHSDKALDKICDGLVVGVNKYFGK